MVWSCFWDKEKDSFLARRIRDVHAFKYEDSVAELVADWSGRPTHAGFYLQPGTARALLQSDHKLCKSFNLTIDHDSDWETVIDTLEEWKQMGCGMVKVELKLRVVRTPKSSRADAPLDAFIKDDSDDEVTYIAARKATGSNTLTGQSPMLKKAISKVTVTEKKLQDEKAYEQIDEINKHHVKRICKENACPRASCSQNGMPCVTIGDSHVKVLSDELAAWSSKIEKGYATFTRPHDSLMKALERRAEKMIEKGNKKKPGKGRRSNSSSSSGGDGRRRGRKRSRRDSNRGRDRMHETLQTMLVFNQLSNGTAGAGRPNIPAPADIPSSPARIPDSSQMSIDGYVSYLQRKEPARSERWVKTGDILEANDVSFQLLPEFTIQDLQSIGVTIGHARILLSREIKKYVREHSGGDSESSEHT